MICHIILFYKVNKRWWSSPEQHMLMTPTGNNNTIPVGFLWLGKGLLVMAASLAVICVGLVAKDLEKLK